MTREVELFGKKMKLYKVQGYENAWCSDRQLTHQIERKRRELFREISLSPRESRALEESQI